jgi:hypothetical protein
MSNKEIIKVYCKKDIITGSYDYHEGNFYYGRVFSICEYDINNIITDVFYICIYLYEAKFNIGLFFYYKGDGGLRYGIHGYFRDYFIDYNVYERMEKLKRLGNVG